jgi:hypothetical protein
MVLQQNQGIFFAGKYFNRFNRKKAGPANRLKSVSVRLYESATGSVLNSMENTYNVNAVIVKQCCWTASIFLAMY